MPDKRKHRGPHPEDRDKFAGDHVSELATATANLCWLLSRGYAVHSSTKLVGDRYTLDTRQRVAIGRCACADDRAARRRDHQRTMDDLSGQSLWIDGFNVLTTVEAALAGGAILLARDGCYRDMASMHGSYKKVSETNAAIVMIGKTLHQCGVKECRWLLDQPVSNSGRLKTMLGEIARQEGWDWSIELVPDPDRILKRCEHVVASADSVILDHAGRWVNLAREVVQQHVPDAWVVDLSCESGPLC